MSDQGNTYAAFIEVELKAERERRSAFDARGQALVTASAALVTLLVGLSTLARSRVTTSVSTPVLIMVGSAVALFAGAATCGILAGWNRHYAVAKSSTLSRMLDEHWVDDEVDARNNVATLHVATIDTLRRANEFKARCVTIGLVVQVLALGTLGTAAVMIIAHI